MERRKKVRKKMEGEVEVKEGNKGGRKLREENEEKKRKEGGDKMAG